MKKNVVITGFGLLSPVGNDKESFWTALCEGRSGVGFLNIETQDDSLRPMGSAVPEFNTKDIVKPRKNIKVMSRDILLALASAVHAAKDANLVTEGDNRTIDPDRFGVVYGSDLIGAEVDMQLDAYRAGIQDGKYEFNHWGRDAMEKIFPLWMLKFLPNMPACHIAIALDARGPSNSVTLCRGSSLAAVFEAAKDIERGAADMMMAGGCGNRVNQDFLTRVKSYHIAPRQADPTRVPRPFDADRCGYVLGEGSGTFVLEDAKFAEARGAKVVARIRGFSEVIEPTLIDGRPTGEAIRRSIRKVLKESGLTPKEIGHVNANGLGDIHDDRIEAEAIQAELGDVPVTATKGNFGDLGSGTGSVELAATLLTLEHGLIPPTKNHDKTAADCPINVVHGKPMPCNSRFAMKLNQTRTGRAYAMIIEKE